MSTSGGSNLFNMASSRARRYFDGYLTRLPSPPDCGETAGPSRQRQDRYCTAIADLTEIRGLIAGAESETQRLLVDVRVLDDDDVRSPSTLPGWTRGHVLTHLARNADAQVRLLEGALGDERVEQYQGGLAGRAEEIEFGASRSARSLAEDVEQSAERLAAMWQRMSEEAWDRPATGAIAGERPASATVWARWGELAFHHVDLTVGFSPSNWSTTFVERVLRRTLPRIGERLVVRNDISVVVEDLSLSWSGSPGADLEVKGPSHALVAWMTGRPGPWLDLIETTRDGVQEELPAVRAWA
jgi:maleylpyruvate isomerase